MKVNRQNMVEVAESVKYKNARGNLSMSRPMSAVKED